MPEQRVPATSPLVRAGLLKVPMSRAVVIGSLLRSVGVVAVTLLVYALVPIGRETALAFAAIALLGMVILSTVFVRQLTRIARSATPMAAAIEALALVFGMFLALFAFLYVSLDANSTGSFTQPIDKMGGVYFSVTVLATVGFGDIAPVTNSARLAVTAQMVLDLILIGAAVKLLGASARQAVQSRDEQGQAQPTTTEGSAGAGLDSVPTSPDRPAKGDT